MAANVYELIFSDPYLVDEFSVFSDGLPWSRRNTITDKSLSVFIESLNYSIKSYWSFPDKWRSNASLRQGMREIQDYLMSLAYLMHGYKSNGKKDELELALAKVSTIANFLSGYFFYRGTYSEAHKAGKVPQFELDVVGDEWEGSLNMTYAHTLYKFFETMAVPDDLDDKLYHHLVEIIHALDESGMDAIRNKFLEKIWEQIANNEDGTFPAITRTYLNVMSIQITPDRGGWRAEERTKILSLLERLKPRIMAKEKMVNGKLIEEELLPKSIYFDHGKTEEFVLILGFGRGPRRIVGTDTVVPEP